MMVIHYTWIGPPRIRINQSDVLGPKAMMKALRRDQESDGIVINFWCLDAHVDVYRNYFKAHNFPVLGGEKLTVRGIESHLDEKSGVRRGKRDVALRQMVNWLWYSTTWDTELVVKHLVDQSSRRGATVREIVNAKNIWSLYLLSRLGGYVLDTGVGPAPDGVNFQAYETFKAPAEGECPYEHARINHKHLRGMCSAATTPVVRHFGIDPQYNRVGPRLDVWTMYSPAGGVVAQRALEWYMRFWYVLEEVRSGGTGGEDYYKDLCRNGVISSIMTGIAHGENGMCTNNLRDYIWHAELEGDTPGIDAIGIRKTYYSSHH